MLDLQPFEEAWYQGQGEQNLLAKHIHNAIHVQPASPTVNSLAPTISAVPIPVMLALTMIPCFFERLQIEYELLYFFQDAVCCRVIGDRSSKEQEDRQRGAAALLQS